MPDLHVIGAGSLLEVRMKTEGWSFPVGRVEFLYLYPLTFDEFLSVTGEDILLKSLMDLIREQLMDSYYQGGLWEAFVGQELLAANSYNRNALFFWIREEKGTSSELDFLVLVEGKLIPIEVKSGSQGSLKSLHQYLSRSSQRLGVRFYNNGSLKLENHLVILPRGEKLKYQLLSIPLYLTFRWEEILKEVQ